MLLQRSPASVETMLDGSSNSIWKLGRFSPLKKIPAYQNATGYIRDQCCHLQAEWALLLQRYHCVNQDILILDESGTAFLITRIFVVGFRAVSHQLCQLVTY